MGEISVLGGIFLMSSGLGILQLRDCKTLNMLPALIVPPIFYALMAAVRWFFRVHQNDAKFTDYPLTNQSVHLIISSSVSNPTDWYIIPLFFYTSFHNINPLKAAVPNAWHCCFFLFMRRKAQHKQNWKYTYDFWRISGSILSIFREFSKVYFKKRQCYSFLPSLKGSRRRRPGCAKAACRQVCHVHHNRPGA